MTAAERAPDTSPWEGLTPPYGTIVVDPPWPYEDGPTGRQAESGKRSFLPYSTMTLSEIAALPVGGLGSIDAHLYLWTTQRFLWEAKPLAEAWGFRVVQPLTWCKDPATAMRTGGAFMPTTEFVIYARRNHGPFIATAREAAGMTRDELNRAVRGNSTGLASMWEMGIRYPNDADWQRIEEVLGVSWSRVGLHKTRHETAWWEWKRTHHSAKPAAFMDVVEQVSPGPYVELFARAPRLGWDAWGLGYESEVDSAHGEPLCKTHAIATYRAARG